MSKIAKKPVTIKEGANVVLENNKVKVSGPKGALEFSIPNGIKVDVVNGQMVVSQEIKNDKETRSLFGLTRAMINNMVIGVTQGFEKKLELSGVGYRAQSSGDIITLSVGFSHPVIIKGGEGINFKVEENIITVSGMDKEKVGDMAAKVRSIRVPEPYKGKGIKYLGERIRRKAGKAAKALGGAAGAK